MEYIDNLRAFFNSGVTLDLGYRIDALKKLKQSILDHKQDLFDAFIKDFNKSEVEVIATELVMVLGELDYMIRHIKKFARPKRVNSGIFNFPAKGYIYKEPYGVVLVMSPWNYPFQLTMVPLISAIACGNVCVVKPSNYSYNVSNVIKEILDVFSPTYIYTCLGGREKNQELLDQKFDFIFFTGGATVGRLVMEKASQNLTPVILELGGKSPVIIDESADLELCAKRVTWGKFLNAGQTCVAPDYVLIKRELMDDYIKLVKKYIHLFYYDKDTIRPDFTHIINDKHVDRLKGLIDPNKCAEGGIVEGRLIYPTVLKDVSFDDPVMQEEIFGPIMPIIPYDNLGEVINMLKSKDKPLALYLFSNNKKVQKLVLENVSFGGGCINDTIMHLTSHDLPFGGVGKSGMGSYHGEKSFSVFSHEKSVLKKKRMELKFKYPPFKKFTLNVLRRFVGMKKEDE